MPKPVGSPVPTAAPHASPPPRLRLGLMGWSAIARRVAAVLAAAARTALSLVRLVENRIGPLVV